jgi:dienelactone hydrolase
VSFASPLGGRAPAFVVEPEGPARKSEKRAGIVFLHHGQGDRSTFLDEAARLAERGVVSVLLEAPDNRETDAPVPLPFDAESEEHAIRQTIVDLRRSFDLLEARADVDRRRLAYVGWSLGATMGSRLAGVEPRARGFVMIAGWASLTQAASQGHGVFGAVYDAWATGTRREAWRARIEPLDGTHFLDGRAPMLLQFATRDAYISRFDAALYAAAAFPGATSAEYDATHFEMGREDAARDREEWLARLLSLPPR